MNIWQTSSFIIAFSKYPMYHNETDQTESPSLWDVAPILNRIAQELNIVVVTSSMTGYDDESAIPEACVYLDSDTPLARHYHFTPSEQPDLLLSDAIVLTDSQWGWHCTSRYIDLPRNNTTIAPFMLLTEPEIMIDIFFEFLQCKQYDQPLCVDRFKHYRFHPLELFGPIAIPVPA